MCKLYPFGDRTEVWSDLKDAVAWIASCPEEKVIRYMQSAGLDAWPLLFAQVNIDREAIIAQIERAACTMCSSGAVDAWFHGVDALVREVHNISCLP